ncbi:TetR/AcrR family transcriptional regulator [Haloechinothrix sp. LS1_15]|uniref:TetR/AcrR family transcriptional regulator n=1 Tax=Haloechinothrix sp. LS1_15 TaxID=2652248 RepID=UPI002945586E|nr:TetR/AcrR family transcriptional regulator [Haloechinothrix sp. LS1_15]MDV6012732.1 TetR/AcrR family transcriptional regulator [Haloechinothrix sp. LS1_15]
MRSRRLEYSESTRNALVDSATALFTKRGYAGTSLDEIAKRARVTKGALYHHFSGKQALFEAVFDAVERRVHSKLTAVTEGDGAPWERAVEGLRTFLDICLEPEYQRIVIHEAPVVMGAERWREAESHYSYGVVRSIVNDLVEAGELIPSPVEITSRLVFGALSAAASAIASSSDPKEVSAQTEEVITQILIRAGASAEVAKQPRSRDACGRRKKTPSAIAGKIKNKVAGEET